MTRKRLFAKACTAGGFAAAFLLLAQVAGHSYVSAGRWDGGDLPVHMHLGNLSSAWRNAAIDGLRAWNRVTTEHREFATTTAGLLELAAWLTEAGCTHVAMEATGVYWKPVWHILEDAESFTLVLANAQHIRNVPGRKSDRNDAAWIADLLAHGLIRGSFVPPAPIQELRDLTRTRKQLVREIARHTQRLQKTLEDANVKLTRVVTDILGVSGRAILAALIAGETDPERLADCTNVRVKASRADIVAAVHGRVTAHHCFLLELHLGQIDALRAAVQPGTGASR